MEKLFDLKIQKRSCNCQEWNIFVGKDQESKPEDGNLIHSCEKLEVYQKGIIFHYIWA